MAKRPRKPAQSKRHSDAFGRGHEVIKFKPPGRQHRPAARSTRARRVGIAILGTLAAAGLAYGGVKLAVDPRFALDRVEVNGAARTGYEQVVAAAAIRPRVNVWLVDSGEAEQRVAQLPWVLNARVARAWPNRLSIEVSERVPVVRLVIGSKGQAPDLALVDAEGRVLQVGGLAPDDERLPLMRIQPAPRPVRAGEQLQSEELMGALEASRRLTSLGVHISEIQSNPASGISVITDSRLRAIFGDSDELERKATLFLAIARRISHPNDVSYVDVRSTNAPTVQYR